MTDSFAPVPPEKSIKVKFHRILDEASQKLIDDRFVVVIKIKKGPIESLFMDQDGKSYYRLDGQTRKYTPEEYHEELIVRNMQQQSLEEYVQTNNTPEKKAEVTETETNTTQQLQQEAITSDNKNYESKAVRQALGDDLNNYDYSEKYEECEEGWYQEMYIPEENCYPNPTMGVCFSEFMSVNPFFAHQNYFPQAFPIMYPQQQCFYPNQPIEMNNQYMDPSYLEQQYLNNPAFYEYNSENNSPGFDQQQQHQQQQQQQQQQMPSEEKKESDKKVDSDKEKDPKV